MPYTRNLFACISDSMQSRLEMIEMAVRWDVKRVCVLTQTHSENWVVRQCFQVARSLAPNPPRS